MMMVKLFEFSKNVTEDYDKFDLKNVYERTMEFVVKDVVNFYFEYSRQKKISAGGGSNSE